MDNNKNVVIKRKELRRLLSKREWLCNLEIVIILCFVLLFINVFLFNIAVVSGDSMQPTYHNRDILLMSKAFYSIKNGDIIAIKKDNLKDAIVKRVIASEGQTVYIDFENGDIYVNDRLVKEDYINEKTFKVGNIDEEEYPLTVPKDCYFVMGDNRNNSVDSRYEEIGMVKSEEILGEIIFKIWG